MISEISTLFGLNIYTDEGRYIGRVEDVVIDLGRRQVRGLAVNNFNKVLIESRATGVILPYRLVKSVGDIVLIKDIFRRKKKETEEQEESPVEESQEEMVEAQG